MQNYYQVLIDGKVFPYEANMEQRKLSISKTSRNNRKTHVDYNIKIARLN